MLAHHHLGGAVPLEMRGFLLGMRARDDGERRIGLAAELHRTFSVTFNDDSGALVITLFDQSGAQFGQRPFDTRIDAAQVMRVDAVYKRVIAGLPEGLSISKMTIGACDGFVHQVMLQ